MQTLPQGQNQKGWKPTVSLRDGQRRLYETIRDNPHKSQYLIQLPTGYGKSWCACIAYATMRDQGRVNRLLLVVPTDQQRRQYVEGLVEDLRILGIPCSGIEQCVNGDTWILKQSYQNKSEIFVAGVQSIAADPGYYADLMSKCRWLVVADEYHHYGQQNTWGQALLSLPSEVVLGMSATPMRGDSKPTIFGKADFDVLVSLEEAFREGAIRNIKTRISNYTITWQTSNSGPQDGLMTELTSEACGDLSEYEIKRNVRYLDKYVSSIFWHVLDAWQEYEDSHPGQNQILVFAMTCRHAQSVASIINEITAPTYGQPFADWIGVGDVDEGNRTDKENQQILDAFQDNKLKCLVQVNKAGEGFNNKRCSIGLMLDLIGDTPMKRQHIGRFMRVNPQVGKPNPPALIFVSEDSPCLGILEQMGEVVAEIKDESSENEKQGAGMGEMRQLRIPDVVIMDAQWSAERIAWPLGSKEETVDLFIKQDPVISVAIQEGRVTREEIDSRVMEFFASKSKAEFKPMTSAQRRDEVRKQVEINARRVVGFVIRRNYGNKTVPKTVMSDLNRAIHVRWKKVVGGSKHAEMTEEDFYAKNKWLQRLAEEIQENGVPTWLNL